MLDINISIQDLRVKLYVSKEQKLGYNTVKKVACTWGQCTSSLQYMVKVRKDYKYKEVNNDFIWLL